MRNVKTTNYIRVDKRTASILFETGRNNRLYFCPVNLSPESPWGLLYRPLDNEEPFDAHVQAFERYNCQSTETGRYTAFYVPRDWWELCQAVNQTFDPDDPVYETLRVWEANHP